MVTHTAIVLDEEWTPPNLEMCVILLAEKLVVSWCTTHEIKNEHHSRIRKLFSLIDTGPIEKCTSEFSFWRKSHVENILWYFNKKSHQLNQMGFHCVHETWIDVATVQLYVKQRKWTMIEDACATAWNGEIVVKWTRRVTSTFCNLPNYCSEMRKRRMNIF